MKEEIKKQLDGFIKKGEKILKNNDAKECEQYCDEALYLYSGYILNLEKNLPCITNSSGIKEKTKDEMHIKRAKFMVEKLKLFKLNEYEDVSRKEMSGMTINNNNILENTVQVTFEDVHKSINHMHGYSKDSEIINKLDELEKIIKSSEEREKKWGKARDIIIWMMDKGIDVFIAVMPLLTRL